MFPQLCAFPRVGTTPRRPRLSGPSSSNEPKARRPRCFSTLHCDQCERRHAPRFGNCIPGIQRTTTVGRIRRPHMPLSGPLAVVVGGWVSGIRRTLWLGEPDLLTGGKVRQLPRGRCFRCTPTSVPRNECAFGCGHTAQCARCSAPRGLVSAVPGCAARTRRIPLRTPFRGFRSRVVGRVAGRCQGPALPASNRRLCAGTSRASPRGFPMSATANRGDASSRSDSHGRDGGAWGQTTACRGRRSAIRGTPGTPHQVGSRSSERPPPGTLATVDGLGPSRGTALARR